jgi:hypothetical protein
MSLEESAMKPRVPSGLDRDLENARVLIEDEPWCESPQKYRKAAEIILRRVLTVDPNNATAKALLMKAESPLIQPAAIVTPTVIPPAEPVEPALRLAEPVAPFAMELPNPIEAAPPTEEAHPVEPTLTMEAQPTYALEVPPPTQPEPAVETASSEDTSAPSQDDYSFLVQTLRTTPPQKRARPSIPVLVGIAIAIVLSGFLMFGFPSNKGKAQFPPTHPETPPPPANTPEVPATASAEQPPLAPPIIDSARAPVQPATVLPVATPPSTTTPVAPVAIAAVTVPLRQPASVEAKPRGQAPAPAQTGTLAVSSPTTVEIYMGDQFLGSAPTTLELPAGNQRLEYRHKDMKKVVTYVINPNETTTTMVTFDIPVQINAKPWAQVFIEGSQRQSLGQTPLSDVLVPIGSMLVFENPNFQGKRYRVKGTETTIQVTFP